MSLVRGSLHRMRGRVASASRHSVRQNINRGMNLWERNHRATRLRSRPLVLEVSPTKRCNIGCIFCIKYPTKGPKDLTLERYNMIARMLFPYSTHVSFCTGGEPLLNPHLPEFISIADRRGVGSSLTTNGMLLSPELSRHFVDTSGMSLVAISFDGATKQMVEGIRVGVNYEQVLANATELVRRKRERPENRTELAIRFSVMHRNLPELPDAVRLWSEIGADKVIVRYLIGIEKMDASESLWFHQEEAREKFAEAAEAGRRYNIPVDLPDPLDGPVLNRPCYAAWRSLNIDTDGTVRFCYEAWDQPVGNLFQANSFEDLWNNETYRKIRASVNSDNPHFPYCNVCEVRRGSAQKTSHFYKTEGIGLELLTFRDAPATCVVDAGGATEG